MGLKHAPGETGQDGLAILSEGFRRLESEVTKFRLEIGRRFDRQEAILMAIARQLGVELSES